MSTRDEGKTHFYGDDCPGGHRAANVAGVDWDDQETADEANEREAAERHAAALVPGTLGDVVSLPHDGHSAAVDAVASKSRPVEVSDEMVDAYVRAIFSGWYIEMKGEELRQDVRAGLAAVVPLIRAQVAAEQSGWPFDVQVAHALRRLDGSTASSVALLTGMSRDEIERVGGVSPADEPVADVRADKLARDRATTGSFLERIKYAAALHPDVDMAEARRLWAEVENGPPMPPGWCTWHQMVDCAGAAPECREARAELNQGGDRG